MVSMASMAPWLHGRSALADLASASACLLGRALPGARAPDVLRAIVAAGGTIDHDWALPQALAVGDHATGTHVLTDLYAQWKDKPVQYDLPALWTQLGVRTTPDGVEFSDSAPLAAVREAITKAKGNPIHAIAVPAPPPVPAP